MNKPLIARQCFNEGYNCAQAILFAYSEEFGLSKDMALKLSTGLGSGMNCGEVCGAVTGALIVIGLKYGNGINGSLEDKETTNKLIAEFYPKFKEKNGSIICKEILKHDLSIEDELKIIIEKNLFGTVCPYMVESAVEILEELL